MHLAKEAFGRDAYRGTGTIPPPTHPIFYQKKKCAQAKIEKCNINKIYQIELRLKEMTYLMIKTFSAFQFFN